MISDATLARALPRSAVILLGDLIRWSLWAAAVIAGGTVVAVYARLVSLLLSRPGSNDFTIFYYTARMVAEGLPMYGDLPRAYGLDWKASHLGNLNPPHFQLLIAPLALLAYRPAMMVWLAVNAAVTAVSLRAIVRELQITLTFRAVLLGVTILFASVAYTSVATTGEMSLLLFWPFTRAWIAARHGRWTAAGAWLGVAASLKLFLLAPVAWLAATGRWRAACMAVAVMAAAAVIGSLAFGPAVYGEWAAALGRVGWWGLPMNASLRGLVERLVSPGGGMAPAIHAPGVAVPLSQAASVVVVMVTAWSTWASREGEPPAATDRTFLLLLLAALLVSPLGWVYYLPLATGPLLGWLRSRPLSHGPLAARALLVGSLVLLYVPFEIVESGQPSPWATLFLASMYGWAVLGCWTALVWIRPEPAPRVVA